MPTGTINSVASIAGISIQSITTRTGSGQISHEVPIPAAAAGTLKTRSDDDEGVFTLAGHSFLVGDVLDIYWDGGLRWGMVVSAVNGDDVTAAGVAGAGSGDVLPAPDAVVNASKPVAVDTDFDGDKLEMIMMMTGKQGHFDFQDSGDASLEAQELAAGEPWQWAADAGIANPLAGNPVDKVKLSNGDSSASATVKLALIYNSDQ